VKRRGFLIYSGSLAAIVLAGCAGQATQTGDTSGMRFSEAERKLILDYYAQPGSRMTSQQMQRVKPGDKLDSGQRPNRLPDELNKRLTFLPEPYTRLILGADVILVNRNTHDILDVIPQIAY
jgi:hypothetical protein